MTANVEVTGAARLYRAASAWTAGLGGWSNNDEGSDIGRFNVPFIIAEEPKEFRRTSGVMFNNLDAFADAYL